MEAGGGPDGSEISRLTAAVSRAVACSSSFGRECRAPSRADRAAPSSCRLGGRALVPPCALAPSCAWRSFRPWRGCSPAVRARPRATCLRAPLIGLAARLLTFGLGEVAPVLALALVF